jgi:hypothetical protein
MCVSPASECPDDPDPGPGPLDGPEPGRPDEEAARRLADLWVAQAQARQEAARHHDTLAGGAVFPAEQEVLASLADLTDRFRENGPWRAAAELFGVGS